MTHDENGMNTYTAVSLFSNCGAGDFGYKKAGFKFAVMAELEAKRLEVCLLNHQGAEGVEGDLRETWPMVVNKYKRQYGDLQLTLLAACPPCQGMSSARGLRGAHEDADAGSKDERNLLAVVIAKVAEALRPKIIVVENVPEFLVRKVRHPDTQEPIAASKLLIERLAGDYDVFPVLLDMSDFGVPQTRKRTFLTFVRKDMEWLSYLKEHGKMPYPSPATSKVITVKEALLSYSLPPLDASDKKLSGSGLHSVPVWEQERYNMVAAIPPYSGKSAWKNSSCTNCGHSTNHLDNVKCEICEFNLPKPITKGTNGEYRLIKGFHTSYKRMDVNKPAATILTASGHIGSHSTIHPYENRVLSALECALLQTLDETFTWGDALKKWGHTNVRAMIGEAVPPLFTQQHGNVLLGLLRCEQFHDFMNSNDIRCVSAKKKLFA